MSAPPFGLVDSNDADTRSRIKQSRDGLPDLRFTSVELIEIALARCSAVYEIGNLDAAILDGEASPAGGLGVTTQLKNELPQCTPIVVVTGRAEDARLAMWSLVVRLRFDLAEGVV